MQPDHEDVAMQPPAPAPYPDYLAKRLTSKRAGEPLTEEQFLLFYRKYPCYPETQLVRYEGMVVEALK